MTFESLGLDSRLLLALADLGFTEPTPVQAKAIPNLLQSTDWMVTSQTGTGKTAAFLLPTLHRIAASLDAAAIAAKQAAPETTKVGSVGFSENTAPAGNQPESRQNFSNRPGKRGDRRDNRIGSGKGTTCEPLALVLCPTRELAQQVSNDAIKLVKHLRGVHVATIIGGMPFGKQIQQLRGANIVVATPGRLLDLFQQRAIVLSKVEVLIADEADRMLDMGFVDDLHAISSACSNRSQTLMFSATFAANVVKLGQNVMNNPQRLDLAPITQRNENITQTLHWVDNFSHKNKILDHWLRDSSIDQAIIFASTQMDTENLAERLEQDGFAAVALHGAMPQAVRNRRLTALREGRFKVLVATDVAARGIDVPTITHVFNYGLPMKPEDYVHRIGRTGRAGRKGLAITLAEPRDRFKIRAIEQITRSNITPSVIAGLEPQVRAPSGGGNSGRGNFNENRGFNQNRGGFNENRGFNQNRGGSNENRGFNQNRGGFNENRGSGDNRGFAEKPAWGHADKGRSDFARPAFNKPAYGGNQGANQGNNQGGYQGRSDQAHNENGFQRRTENRNEGRNDGFNRASNDGNGFGGERPAFVKPAFAKPAFGKPAFGKPAFGKPAFNKPDFAKSDFQKPAFDKPAYDKPAFGKPAFGKPAFDRPNNGKPSFGKPSFGKPSFGKPDFNKAAASK